jgi:hypothetical protein
MNMCKNKQPPEESGGLKYSHEKQNSSLSLRVVSQFNIILPSSRISY